MSIQTEFAASIRAARKRVGWSQTQLAQRSGVHLNTVSQIERAAADPRLSSMLALCSQLNLQLLVAQNMAAQEQAEEVGVPAFLRPSHE